MTRNSLKITSVSALAGCYDVFFIDIWGVLHDGIHVYKGSREALRYLTHTAKKQTVLVSNAPRRAFLAQEKLREIGIEDDDYTAIVTSGETARHLLTHSFTDPRARGNYYMLGSSRDGDCLHNIKGFSRVANSDHADMIFLTGYDDAMTCHADVFPYLKRFHERNLYMINANPDKRIERINGDSVLCAGSIADSYRDMGGTVSEIGKPYAEIYTFAQEHAPIHAPSPRIACIGDNMDTDIKGACNNGFDGYLVASGMHRNAIETCGMDNFLKDYTWAPDGILPTFSISA